MKVLIIARPFVFHGGVETATTGLVQALVEHGHELHWLGPGRQPPMRGVTVHRLRIPPLPRTGRLLAVAALARLAVRRGRWDVVQSHERTLDQDVYRAGEGCHRGYLSARESPGATTMYHRLVLALERRVFERTARIVAIARSGKAEIERLYGLESGRVNVVYNGVDLERFHPRNRAAHRRATRAEAGVPDGALVALFVGSGFERKGLLTAIEALAAVREPTSRLLVIGRGDTAAYRALAARLGVGDRVQWLGVRPDLERWYGGADALVLPARYEPFGNVHLEALASGLPVLTSTRAGGSEIIEEGVNGAIREPYDTAGFAKALEWVRNTSTDELANAARRSAEPFTFARQVSELVTIWRTIVGARGDFP
jgi:UDP-glucose:(heptosyl)LPS alpha-1,3-glucosyltransferase